MNRPVAKFMADLFRTVPGGANQLVQRFGIQEKTPAGKFSDHIAGARGRVQPSQRNSPARNRTRQCRAYPFIYLAGGIGLAVGDYICLAGRRWIRGG